MCVILPATVISFLSLTIVLQSPFINSYNMLTANESSFVYQTGEFEQSNSSCPPWKYTCMTSTTILVVHVELDYKVSNVVMLNPAYF